jgi:3-oxoacyl-[acyl-carrier protein] reductase
VEHRAKTAQVANVEAGPIDQISEEAWDRHFDVNVKGYFLAVREAVKVMKAQRGGVILLNASKGAFAPTVNNAAYASSKAAVAALARNLATELGPFGIRVNYFNADFVDTPLMRRLIEQRAAQKGVSTEAQTAEYRSRNVLGVGPIPAAAVAEAALFLASPRSGYTTGTAITIDGGIKEAIAKEDGPVDLHFGFGHGYWLRGRRLGRRRPTRTHACDDSQRRQIEQSADNQRLH